MKSNKKRTVAKFFLFLTVLGVLVLLAEGFLFLAEQEWAKLSLPFVLPFAMKHMYILITLAAVLFFLSVSVLLFLGARASAGKGRFVKKSQYRFAEEPIDSEEVLAKTSPVAVSKAPISKSVKINCGTEEKTSMARVILPLVGGCIIGAVAATVICKRKQTVKKTKPSVYVFGLNKKR